MSHPVPALVVSDSDRVLLERTAKASIWSAIASATAVASRNIAWVTSREVPFCPRTGFGSMRRLLFQLRYANSQGPPLEC